MKMFSARSYIVWGVFLIGLMAVSGAESADVSRKTNQKQAVTELKKAAAKKPGTPGKMAVIKRLQALFSGETFFNSETALS